MKKHIFLFLGIISLTACATFQQQAFDWRGQNFDSYVLNYGVPSSQYTLQDGNNVYSFKTNCPDTNAQEEVLIIINSDNVIQEISRTAACPRVYYEPAPMPVPQEHYTTRHIDTPPQKPVQVKPEPKPLEKPAPKPQVKPEPRPQGQNVAPQPQKPVQDKPATKPQEQTPSYAQNTKPVTNKPGQNAKTSEIFSKQTKEVKITGQESLANKKNNVLLAGKTENTNTQKQNSSNQAQEVKQETKKEMPIKQNQTKVAKLFKK